MTKLERTTWEEWDDWEEMKRLYEKMLCNSHPLPPTSKERKNEIAQKRRSGYQRGEK